VIAVAANSPLIAGAPPLAVVGIEGWPWQVLGRMSYGLFFFFLLAEKSFQVADEMPDDFVVSSNDLPHTTSTGKLLTNGMAKTVFPPEWKWR